MSKKGQEIVVWTLIVVGLGAIVLGIYGAVAIPTEPTGETTQLVTPVTNEEWVRGNKDARVTIVEYSDFECPACKYFYGMMKQLEQEKGEQVRVVYRHFPLQQHRSARMAAVAAEAAGKQGKFWEMHDILFEKQEEWSKSENVQQTLVSYATVLRLDIGRFMNDMQSVELAEKVERGVAEGIRQNIQGTPTFYLNGAVVQFRSYEELSRLVDEKLGK